MTGSTLLNNRRVLRLGGSVFAISVGYILGQLLGGSVVSAVGLQLPPVDDAAGAFWSLLASAFLIGLTITLAAQWFTGSRLWHLLSWGALVFLGTVGIILEGMFFFPGALPAETVPGTVLAQFVAAIVTAAVAAVVLGSTGQKRPPLSLSVPYTSILGRIGLCSVVYMLLFMVIGELTFELATRPYYETMEGLAVPSLSVIVPLELFRGVLIVGSVLPLLIGLRTTMQRQILVIVWSAFVLSGLAPLLLQAHTLPPTLLGIHAVEIFLMIGPTGVVIVWFLRPERIFADSAST